MKQIVTSPSFVAFATCEGKELETRFKDVVELILLLNVSSFNHRLRDAVLLFTQTELKLLLRQCGSSQKKQ